MSTRCFSLVRIILEIDQGRLIPRISVKKTVSCIPLPSHALTGTIHTAQEISSEMFAGLSVGLLLTRIQRPRETRLKNPHHYTICCIHTHKCAMRHKVKPLWEGFYLRHFDHAPISYKGNPLAPKAFGRLTHLRSKGLGILSIASKYLRRNRLP